MRKTTERIQLPRTKAPGIRSLGSCIFRSFLSVFFQKFGIRPDELKVARQTEGPSHIAHFESQPKAALVILSRDLQDEWTHFFAGWADFYWMLESDRDDSFRKCRQMQNKLHGFQLLVHKSYQKLV